MNIASVPTAPTTAPPPGALACVTPSSTGDSHPLGLFLSFLANAGRGDAATDDDAHPAPQGNNDSDGTKESIAALFAPAQVIAQDATAVISASFLTAQLPVGKLTELSAVGQFNGSAEVIDAGGSQRLAQWLGGTTIAARGEASPSTLSLPQGHIEPQRADMMQSALAFAVQLTPGVEAEGAEPATATALTPTTASGVAAPADRVLTAEADLVENGQQPKVVVQGVNRGVPPHDITPGQQNLRTPTPISQGRGTPRAVDKASVNMTDDTMLKPLQAPQGDAGKQTRQEQQDTEDDPRSRSRITEKQHAPDDAAAAQTTSAGGASPLNTVRPELASSSHGNTTLQLVAETGTTAAPGHSISALSSKAEIPETNTSVHLPSTREISMRIAPPESPSVDITVIDRAGSVRVAVRTPDSDLAHNLQGGLNDLVQKLERQGFSAEAWSPHDGTGTGAAQSSNGDSGGSSAHNGSRDPRDSSQQSYSGEQNGGRNRPRWVMELEQRFAQAASE